MNNDLNQARSRLQQGGFTCVLCRGDVVLSSRKRGVAPLLEFLNAELAPGFSAADKVVGKATAFLYCLLGVRAVYAPVMSSAAIRVLREHGIEYVCDTEVDAIFNRTRDGFCPMETAVREIEDPHLARDAITQTLKNLAGTK